MVAEAGQSPAASPGQLGLSVAARQCPCRPKRGGAAGASPVSKPSAGWPVIAGYTPTARSLFDDPLSGVRPCPLLARPAPKALEWRALRPSHPVYANSGDILQRQLSDAIETGRDGPLKWPMGRAGRSSRAVLNPWRGGVLMGLVRSAGLLLLLLVVPLAPMASCLC